MFMMLGCDFKPSAEDAAGKIVEMSRFNFDQYRNVNNGNIKELALCKEKLTVANDLMKKIDSKYAQTQIAKEFVTVRLKESIVARLAECTRLYDLALADT